MQHVSKLKHACPGYVFQHEDDEGGAEDCDDDDEQGTEHYDDCDEVDGFEDWRMHHRVHDADGDGELDNPGSYDDGHWPAEQEGLPELIFTEGCDEDGVDLGPCISLQRCSNGSRLSANGSGPSGDVDAVRVMLLGVTDSGRPSVGIDLGYACTQQNLNQNASNRASTGPHTYSYFMAIYIGLGGGFCMRRMEYVCVSVCVCVCVFVCVCV